MTQKQHTILLVEDEEPIRLALRRIFTRNGWVVSEALDGSQALAMLLAPPGSQYDVVLSDLRMPGMSGAKLHDHLLAERPVLAARMVFSTGDIYSDEAQDLVVRRGCVVLQKPFDLVALMALAEKMVAP